jgi:hypothetical protein
MTSHLTLKFTINTNPETEVVSRINEACMNIVHTR